MVSISSKSMVGRASGSDTERNSAAGLTSVVSIGLGVSVSMISSARVLPLPGSGERNAMRGVDSKQSSRCACASQRVTAT